MRQQAFGDEPMNDSGIDNGDFDDLFAAVCDDRATDEQRAKLTELLRSSADARDDYLRYVDLHAALAEELVPAVESSIIDYHAGESIFADAERPSRTVPERARSARRFTIWASVAAALLICVLGTWAILSWTTPRSPDQQVATNSPSPLQTLATLAWAKDCSWKNHDILEGQPLSMGTYELQSGTAMLRMTGGAEIVMVGASRIEIRSAGSAQLHFGNVVVRASDDAEGFTLWTPNSEVVDLGTEFAVKVTSSGDTEVHVLDGIVEYRRQRTPRPSPTVMRAGDAIVARAGATTTESVELQSRRFHEIIDDGRSEDESPTATVFEPFDYATGVISIASGDGGNGWAGPWRLRRPSERRNGQAVRNDEPEQLEIAIPAEPDDAMLLMPAGFSCYVRPLAEPVRMDRDGITYLSLRLKRNQDSPIETWIDPGMRVTLRSSQDYFGRWICAGSNGQDQPFIQTGGGIGATSPTVLKLDESVRWVIKIVAHSRAEDSIYFRVLTSEDELSISEPAAWHLAAQGVDLSLPLDQLLLSCAGPNSFFVDDVRLGPTWRSVVTQ